MVFIPLRIIPDNIAIDFIGKHKHVFTITLLITVLSLILIVTKGLNFGIDFKGGTVIEMGSNRPIAITSLRDKLHMLSLGEVSLQHLDTENQVIIRIGYSSSCTPQEALEKVKHMLKKEYPKEERELRKVEMIGPQVGDNAIKNSILALVLSLGAIVIYLWFRFEWQFGVGGLTALLHDAILTLAFYSVTGFDFNLSSIACLLTVVGFSINDSVVIYDRIRDNRKLHVTWPIKSLINKSINETLSRTILTSGTTLLSILALILVGGSVIKPFALATFFGIVIGTFSSIFISAPLLLYMPKLKKAKEKTYVD